MYKPEIFKDIPLLRNMLPTIVSASSTQSATYTFADSTNNKAYNFTNGTNLTAGNLLVWGVELPAVGYTNLASNNNVNATILSGGTNDWVTFRYVFDINQSRSNVQLLNITWQGSRTPVGYTDAEVPELKVYNWTSNAWVRFATIGLQRGNANTTNYSGVNAQNFIGANGNVTIVAWNLGGLADSGEGIATDFIKLDVTYTDNNPQWSQNSTNGTTAGANILHSVKWTDESLSGYIFEFDNGNGSLFNNTFVTFSGATNWSNISKVINSTSGSTIRWRVYANDSLNQLNSTSLFTYTTTSAQCWTKDSVGKMLIIPTGCIYTGDIGI